MTQNMKKTDSVKREKNLKESPLPPLPFADKTVNQEKTKEDEIDRIRNKDEPLTLKEASTLLAYWKNQQKHLQKMLAELNRNREMSPEALHFYLNNANNFNSEQWEFIKKQRQFLVDSLNLTPDLLEEGVKYISGQPPKKGFKTTKDTKERRNKTQAMYRRGWLPVR